MFIYAEKSHFIGIVQRRIKTVEDLSDFMYCVNHLNIVGKETNLWRQLNHYMAVLKREQAYQTKISAPPTDPTDLKDLSIQTFDPNA